MQESRQLARIIIAILKHQAELILGESTRNAVGQELGDVVQRKSSNLITR
jgi:hypothetical protein